MHRAARAARIGAILDEFYPEPPIPLAHRDPFTLLVAVVLSAQTTDVRVNLVTPALFAAAATPAQLAALGAPAILRLIRTCGLAPTKAKNLAALAQQLVEQHGGQVPADLDALQALPGVGRKTASVVLAQAFGIPAMPIDTHIHRLAKRWRLSAARNVRQTETDLCRLYPPERWHRLHLQMIWFGREHCPALRHEPARCPVCSWAARPVRASAGSAAAAGRGRARASPRASRP
jgi:endonuclease-3